MKMVKMFLNLETTEVVLVHCNFVNNKFQQNLRALHTFVPKNHLVNY